MKHKIYNTEQRQLILNLLKESCDKPLTAADIAKKLENENIGRSTLYRQLEMLTDEGIISRNVKENSRVYVYQIEECNCSEHYHLRCAGCGKMIHLDKQITDAVSTQLLENDFVTDGKSTVLLGKCKKCKEKEND